jgi:putative phosphoesterase
MKIALLSDIHGNSDALLSVLTDISQLNIKHLIIAGDFIGYYYNVDKVLALLSKWKFDAIGGNHEALFNNWIDGENKEYILKKYGSSFKVSEQTLSKKQIKWLVGLPEKKEFTIKDKSVLLCHGSPWGVDNYVYPDVNHAVINKIFSINKDIVIYGHTHYPTVHIKDNQIIVNPGSVGQTRDKTPGACWAVWDTKQHKVSLKRSKYNVDKVKAQCQFFDPNLIYLQSVLTRTNEN